MPLTPNYVRVAIILCKRAPLKGDEARDTADTIDALEELYAMMTVPSPEPQEPKKDVEHPRPDK